MSEILLTTAYLGPLQYYSKVSQAEKVYIEQYDSYIKQTYRNRCRILGANGPLDLIIPIVKNSGVKTLVKDVQIEYTTAWQKKHWKTIVSAYNSSPFFEYYSDDFAPLFENEHKYLIDLNQELNELIVDLLELDAEFQLSTDYEKSFKGRDYRQTITTKKGWEQDSEYKSIPYTQTFAEKFGFTDNLSIIDLLFNVGPESVLLLEEAMVLNE